MKKGILIIAFLVIIIITSKATTKQNNMNSLSLKDVPEPSEYNKKTGRTLNKNVLTVQRNNPGAIFHSSNQWIGLTPNKNVVGTVAWFDTPFYGARAQLKTLISYQEKHGLKTIREILNRYAPPVVTKEDNPFNPHKNPTGSYIKFISDSLNIDADKAISFTDRELLAKFGWYQHVMEAGAAWVPIEVYKRVIQQL